MKWPKCRFFDVEDSCILAGYVGSQSHGTYIAPKNGGIDDKDVMGILVPPIRFYFGLDKFEHLDTWVDEYDLVFYEVRKFFRLLLKNNPNVIGFLWLHETAYIKKTEMGEMLINERDIFSSKQIYHSFTGYAYSQLSKMQKYNCNGHLGSKRKALIEKFGYDTKNASHLIRLLRMGIEFLTTKQLNVLREDAQQLIAIKKGEYSLEKIQQMAEDLFNSARAAFINSSLPDYPNEKKANELLIKIIKDQLNGKI
ncbi:MAG: nucleotidyltransferase domain-containing protein [Ignavibacteria bacterium]|jgi:predicted nucleotidyltransferase